MMKTCIQVCVVALLVGLAGCGGPGSLQDVEGTVTLNGQNLAEGDITFIPADTQFGGEGGKIKDGAFKMKARSGKNKVEIRANREVPGKTVPSAAGPGAKEPLMESIIPPKYNEKTELQADVSASNRSFKFDLKTP